MFKAEANGFSAASVNYGVSVPKDAYTESVLAGAWPIVGSYGARVRANRGEPGRTLANGDLLRIEAVTGAGLVVRRALDADPRTGAATAVPGGSRPLFVVAGATWTLPGRYPRRPATGLMRKGR